MLYFFYKNCVLTVPHLFYAFYNGFSGQTIFDDNYISFYNLFYTSWPIVIKATFDQDINYQMEGEQLKALYPKLYYIGSKSTLFNWSNYYNANVLGFIHALICFYVPLYIFQDTNILLSGTGQNTDIWSLSITSFTCLYSVVTTKIIINTRWWTNVSYFFYSVMSILVYVAYVWLSNYWNQSKVIHSVIETHMSPLFWLCILLIGGSVMLSDLVLEYVRMQSFRNASDYLR